MTTEADVGVIMTAIWKEATSQEMQAASRR